LAGGLVASAAWWQLGLAAGVVGGTVVIVSGQALLAPPVLAIGYLFGVLWGEWQDRTQVRVLGSS